MITEIGTGEGSKINNVTIRAWIVLSVTAVSCLSSILITGLNCWAAMTGKTVNVVFEPILANVLFMVIGWYFGSTKQLPPADNKEIDKP